MQILFPSLYITIQQLKVLLEYFPPEEGYLRIQLIQALFSHIIDLENMNMIIDEVLTFDERNEVRQLYCIDTSSSLFIDPLIFLSFMIDIPSNWYYESTRSNET